jgi:hypothetical protein
VFITTVFYQVRYFTPSLCLCALIRYEMFDYFFTIHPSHCRFFSSLSLDKKSSSSSIIMGSRFYTHTFSFSFFFFFSFIFSFLVLIIIIDYVHPLFSLELFFSFHYIFSLPGSFSVQIQSKSIINRSYSGRFKGFSSRFSS